MGNGYDGWLESGIQDMYDDQEERSEYIAWKVEEVMKEGEEFYPFEQGNWAEAISQMLMEEHLQDIDPKTAPQELRDKVEQYWLDCATHCVERDY